MKIFKGLLPVFLSFMLVPGFFTLGIAAGKTEKQTPAQAPEAKSIQVGEQASDTHPEIEEGLSCNDCHEIKLDANTAATQVWLTGESPGRAENEGVLKGEIVWESIVEVLGEKKKKKTFVLATCLNNTPLSTTADFTLDPEAHMLYGFHEKGTEKLIHMKNNPKVSLNWHREFESFDDFLCVQVKGKAALIESGSPEFEKILTTIIPYEYAVKVPAGADDATRTKQLAQFRQSIKPGMVISKITIDQATMASTEFVKKGYRRYQRWVRSH